MEQDGAHGMKGNGRSLHVQAMPGRLRRNLATREMRLSHQEWCGGGAAPSPRFMRIPSIDFGVKPPREECGP